MASYHGCCAELAMLMRRHTFVLDVITCCAVVGFAVFTSVAAPGHRVGCDHVLCSCRAFSVSRPYIFHERCSAVPSYRMWSPTVLLSALAEVPAAPADLTDHTCDAAPAICSTSRSYIFYERCGAMPSCWMCSRACADVSACEDGQQPSRPIASRAARCAIALLQGHLSCASNSLTPSAGTGSFSGPDIHYERCEDTPSCRV